MMDITGNVVNFLSDIGTHFANVPLRESIIFDIALILILSAIFAFIARMFKQPLIPAYVIAGLIIGPLVLGVVKNTELIYAFAEIGIAFLLFSAGLEISFRKIKEASLKKIAIVGTLQVAIVFLITISLGQFFNLDTMQAVYLGIILAFGSTMVVIKLLSERGELVTLHGRLVLGILLLQDLVAIFAIILLMSGGFAFEPIIWAILKLFIIIGIALALYYLVLNKLFRFAAKSPELLFLSALAILFIFIAITYLFELSIVIGAFIAGVLLANSQFKLELESRINPLRDFFSILFFVALGLQIVFVGISIPLFLFLLGVAFILKPIITAFLLRMTGYRPRTSFLTSISLAQLSEFSLIIGALGLAMGVLDVSIFSTIVLATIITMVATTYFIRYKQNIYKVFRGPMRIFNFFQIKENLSKHDQTDKTILLIGAHRMGSIILDNLEDRKEDIVVIDYNPEIINKIVKKRVSAIYGDLANPELLNNIKIEKLKLVISTLPSDEENLALLKKIRKVNEKATIILTAARISDALDLYKHGADYVMVPKVLAGEEIKDVMTKSKHSITKLRQKHEKLLDKIHNILY